MAEVFTRVLYEKHGHRIPWWPETGTMHTALEPARAEVTRRSWLRGVVVSAGLGAGALAVAGCAPGGGRWAEDRHATAGGPHRVSRLVRVDYGPHSAQFATLRVPLDARGREPVAGVPVVVVIHGGSWRAGSTDEYMAAVITDLVSHGVAAWSLSYRGTRGAVHSLREAHVPGWPNTGRDVATAVDLVPQLPRRTGAPLDTSRVVLLGHSAGGHLAVWAASRHALSPGVVGSDPVVRPLGCVSLAGVLDPVTAYRDDANTRIAALLGGTPEQQPRHYRQASPTALLPSGVPVLACHGLRDRVVPAHQSQDYVAAATRRGDPAELYLSEQADHGSWVVHSHPAWAFARERTLRFALPEPATSAGPAHAGAAQAGAAHAAPAHARHAAG